jgi:hypothetical protein
MHAGRRDKARLISRGKVQPILETPHRPRFIELPVAGLLDLTL